MPFETSGNASPITRVLVIPPLLLAMFAPPAPVILPVTPRVPLKVVAPVTPSVPRLVPPVQDGDEPDVPSNNRLTRKQADFIARLARERGMAKGEVDALARERHGKSSNFLTVGEARAFIKQLQQDAA